MNPNSTPPGGLCGRESDELGEKVVGVASGEKAAQAGAQGLDARDRIRDTIHTTLNARGYWLPIEGQHAIADAIAELPIYGVTEFRRLAIQGARRVCDLADAIDQARALADELDTECPWTSSAPDIARRLRETLDKQPKEQP